MCRTKSVSGEHVRRIVVILSFLFLIGALLSFTPSSVEAAAPSKVAYFRDSNPWGMTSNEAAMDVYNIEYDTYTSAEIGNINLAPYDKVITASAQSYSFYQTLSENHDWIESFVAAGGTFEFHGGTYSSQDWEGLEMPGGFTSEMILTDSVAIVNTSHDIPNIPNFISGTELDGWGYSSHGILKDFTMPYDIIFADEGTGLPVAVEIPYYAGSIVATMQTLEWAYYWGYSPVLENFVFYRPPPPDHDIAVVGVDVPDVNERTIPVKVNATIKNTGASQETDIVVNFLVNGVPSGMQMIMSLGMGNYTVLSFMWTPMVDGEYNLTISVPPLATENITVNNQVSRFVTVVDTTAPAEPTGLSVDIVPEGSALNASWDANTEPDLTYYNLYRSMDAITYTRVFQIPTGTEYYLDTGLTNGLTYFYRISAEDYVPNESPWSPAVANAPDFDTDGDGIGDSSDFDDDNDGVPDLVDEFPQDPNEWKDSDKDGIGDGADTDNDNDGVNNPEDDFPYDPKEWMDTDGDGVGDNGDNDDDNDGYPDELEDQLGSDPKDPTSTPLDTDGDGIPDVLDDDDDNDGYADVVEEEAGSDPTDDMSTPPDNDGDGIVDVFDDDDDNDGYTDTIEEQAGSDPFNTASVPEDTDNDGIIDLYDEDDDDDGYYDYYDVFPLDEDEWADTDGDGLGDVFDDDADGDGVSDDEDEFWLDPLEYIDSDQDGIGDNADIDDDNDGIPDYQDIPFPEPPKEKEDITPTLVVVVIVLMIIILIVMFMLGRARPESSSRPVEEEEPEPPLE